MKSPETTAGLGANSDKNIMDINPDIEVENDATQIEVTNVKLVRKAVRENVSLALKEIAKELKETDNLFNRFPLCTLSSRLGYCDVKSMIDYFYREANIFVADAFLNGQEVQYNPVEIQAWVISLCQQLLISNEDEALGKRQRQRIKIARMAKIS